MCELLPRRPTGVIGPRSRCAVGRGCWLHLLVVIRRLSAVFHLSEHEHVMACPGDWEHLKEALLKGPQCSGWVWNCHTDRGWRLGDGRTARRGRRVPTGTIEACPSASFWPGPADT